MGETFLAIGDFCSILLLYQLKLGFFGWNFNITAVEISVRSVFTFFSDWVRIIQFPGCVITIVINWHTIF